MLVGHNEWQLCLEVLLALVLGAYVAGLWWFSRGIGPQAPTGSGTPFVSVVVAARNEAAAIGVLLEGLAGQQYPFDHWEVIVVDDGSDDGTASRVQSQSPALPHLQLLTSRGTGKKAALSQGIAAARGEIVLSTDADCRVPPGWVQGMAASFGPGVDMVVGFSQIAEPGQVRGWREGFEALDFLHLMGAAQGSAAKGSALAASGQNLAYRAEVFGQVGGFSRVEDRASGDDVLLLQLVRRFGKGRIVFSTDPGTYVVHPPSASWGALLRQRARWASNAPYQIFLNRGFFAYISLVFAANLLLVLSPVLALVGVLGGQVVVLVWVGKVLAEARLSWRVTAFFGRQDLRPLFPMWAFVQPFYLVLAGLLGALGCFEWKGRKHRWGR